ncbi:hypothetical protein SLS60_009869 [Paraconiothyrium brasiliense]|uniref:F-box domain-containing protein n=1 Tax=Paraconiothyrium brasiliense TaxID=300254 RepID=A0ABR3QSQ9_9PLEO
MAKRQRDTNAALPVKLADEYHAYPENSTCTESRDDEIALHLDAKRPETSAITFTGGKTEIANTTSPLLKLPGEILNKIYEYALTSEDDLLEHVAVSVASNDPSSTDQVSLGPDMTSPSSNGASHPSTLANEIDGSIVDSRSSALNSTVFQAHFLERDGSEFNQLKYVCKKLWRETCRLELNYNGVLFTDEAGVGVEQIEHFLAACSPSQRQWLKKVTILSGRDEPHVFFGRILRLMGISEHVSQNVLMPYKEYVRLDAFCFNHPSMSINFVINPYRFVETSRNNPVMMTPLVQGMLLRYALRNTLLPAWAFFVPFAEAFLHLLGWPHDHAMPLLQAPNLGIYPQNLVRGTGIGVLLENLERHDSTGHRKETLSQVHGGLSQGI